MLLFLDLLGTFIFAITGGLKAVKRDLDLLGIVVLSVLTGIGGGLIRDVILQEEYPAILTDEKYTVLCIIAGLIVFFTARYLTRFLKLINYLDAVGLGVFTSLGAIKAHKLGLGPIGVCMMAMLSATGGGIVRDLLVNEVPSIVKSDFYATATIIGASSLYLFSHLNMPQNVILWNIIVFTTSIRLFAIIFNIKLPQAYQ